MNAEPFRSVPHRELLRLHVEAVWGVIVPQLTSNEAEVSAHQPESSEDVGPLWAGYLARLADGAQVWLWRADTLPEERAEMARTLERALNDSETPVDDVRREVVFRQIAEPALSLANAQRVARVLGPDDAALARAFYEDDPDYLLAPQRAPVVGVIVDGRALSVAHCSRRTAHACELGIDTKPEARRRGYALASTIVWATSVRAEGLIPFYSALASNTASLALARKAGYREFARAAYLTR